MIAIAPRLTLITDTDRYGEKVLFDTARQALAGGADAILIREKQLTSARLLALASRLRQMTHDAQARLIIHTQIDVALAVDADGVHLSSADIASVNMVREWLADSEKTVSVSCHNALELQQASDHGADYAMLSPVFTTTCHPDAPCLGVDQFNALAASAPLPVVALGGIDADHCERLRGHSIAVISALFTAADPARTAQQLLAATDNGVMR